MLVVFLLTVSVKVFLYKSSDTVQPEVVIVQEPEAAELLVPEAVPL